MERRMPSQLQFSKKFRECGSPHLRCRMRSPTGGFMPYSGFSKLISATALAIAFVALPAIAGSSVASAQDRYYRGRDFGRDGYYDDDLRDHQRRERRRQISHERNDREDLRDHHEEESYRYGDAEDLRHPKQHESQELRGHQRDERDDLHDHQHDERRDDYRYDRYSRDRYRDGYYDNDGRFYRRRY